MEDVQVVISYSEKAEVEDCVVEKLENQSNKDFTWGFRILHGLEVTWEEKRVPISFANIGCGV